METAHGTVRLFFNKNDASVPTVAANHPRGAQWGRTNQVISCNSRARYAKVPSSRPYIADESRAQIVTRRTPDVLEQSIGNEKRSATTDETRPTEGESGVVVEDIFDSGER